MFNRNSGCHKPYTHKPHTGVAPAYMPGPGMGVAPGAKVMGTFQGTVGPGYGPAAPYLPTAVSPVAVGPGYGPAAPYLPTAVSPAAVGPAPFGPAPFGPAPFGPAPVGPAPFGPAPVGPGQVLPTQVAPAQVSPPQELVNTNLMNTVVPHVHPSHTTTVNKHVYTHQHYFPHTHSVVNECYNQQVVCGPRPPIMPLCPPRPFCF